MTVPGFTATDHAMMARALRLAERGAYTTKPNPMVGCVIAQGDAVVGEGWHQRAGEPHAEVFALQAAGERARGATAYVTLEPCNHHGRTPPCVDVLLAAGVRRVVYAVEDPNPLVKGGGAARLRAAGVKVESGLLATEAAELNAGFFMRMRERRPFIRLKSAMSLDGRIALANGESKWITSEAARDDVQQWRARASVVMTSASTVLADDPRLDVRIDTPRQPLRVVLDRRRRVRATARILAPPGEVLLLVGPSPKTRSRRGDGPVGSARVERVRARSGGLDLPKVFARLAELQVNEVHVEAGPRLSGALLSAGLVDEWLVYMAPLLLGKEAKPLAAIDRLTRLDAAPGFTIVESRTVGPDLRLRLRPSPKRTTRRDRK
jgi:diaminohydroxyphosphoribosylaminopyrimidine deaminase/5-amino-6-(5-phosphoribosylamino)uracil reductase